tara:strand:- start:401 stop:814 length:414 start_codon:yes stop_codon:yes gene_type:complete
MSDVIEGGDLVFYNGGGLNNGQYMSGGMQINNMFLTEGISPFIRSANLLVPAGLAMIGGNNKNNYKNKTTIFDKDDTGNSGVIDDDLYNKLLGLCSDVENKESKIDKKSKKKTKKKNKKLKLKLKLNRKKTKKKKLK